MSPISIIVIASVAACLVVVLSLLGGRASKLARELQSMERKLASQQADARGLAARLAAAEEEKKKIIGLLGHAEDEIAWAHAQLETRPTITRKTYRILALGMKATGKTSLTLKWCNTLTDLDKIEGTKIERYQRTVSHVAQKDVIVEHVFEVHDWGGEHIVDAVRELMLEEVHGLLIVVDLGGEDARQVEADRVHEQLQEFNPRVLRYFFGSETVASCKTAVLFINKSDLLAGTPAQVEEQAKKLYAPLIESLHKYSPQIDIRVFVGSASYGHSTHVLFSHFVERILPSSAYDAQLLQRMKSGFSDPAPSGTGAASGSAAAQPVSAPAAPAPGPIWTPPPSPAAGREAAVARANITIPMRAPQAPSIPHGD